MLRGKRVLLRPIEKRDINIIYDFIIEDELKKLDGFYEIPPGKEYIMENFNKIVEKENKYLSIVNEKGVLVGYISFKELKDTCNIYKLGITIGKDFWNRGYGQDSVMTLLQYLFLFRGAQRVELEVLDFNDRAIYAYKKCGFVEEGRKRKGFFSQGQYHDLVIMGIIKEDYFQNK